MTGHPVVAVMLAAGTGSRLVDHTRRAKCLHLVAGRPLVSWIAGALVTIGVRRLVVVTGWRAPEFERALADLHLPIQLCFQRCDDWERGNGRSARSVAHAIAQPKSGFLLLMSDHLVSAAHLERVVEQADLDVAAGYLATSPPSTAIDLEDATKAQVGPDGQIEAIGKELASYNAIDTGVFLFDGRLFEALDAAAQTGDYSLTGGCKQLAARRLMRSVNIGDLPWQDIDTRADLEAADRRADAILSASPRPTSRDPDE